MHRHKSISIPCSSSHITAIQQRSMDTVPPAYQETRQFPHALPAPHTQRQMARQNAKHHQRKRYKDQLRVNFKSCNLDHTKWETLAEDRSAWREECHNAVNGSEEQRIDAAKVRRAARKDRGHSVSSTSTIHTCDMCGRTCSSRIGLFSHKRSRCWDLLCRRLIPCVHGSETWPVRKENDVTLQPAELRMVRWMCGMKPQDRIPSKSRYYSKTGGNGMGMCCEKKTMIGWRNVWSMKLRVPGQEVDQRKLGERLWKSVRHINWTGRMPWIVIDWGSR